MGTVYKWKFDKYHIPAKIAGETIEGIKIKSGKDFIEPEELLEASRDENAPLHSCFEWDDGKAAEKYRLWQAHDIIKNITVEIISEDQTPPQIVRAFVSVAPSNEKGKFVNIKTAIERDDYRKQILDNAFEELQNFKRKYQMYSELEKVFSAIDEFAETLN